MNQSDQSECSSEGELFCFKSDKRRKFYEHQTQFPFKLKEIVENKFYLSIKLFKVLSSPPTKGKQSETQPKTEELGRIVFQLVKNEKMMEGTFEKSLFSNSKQGYKKTNMEVNFTIFRDIDLDEYEYPDDRILAVNLVRLTNYSQDKDLIS